MIADMLRILVTLIAVAVVLVVIFAAGWADDKAQPGSSGRATVRTSP
jgi:hypothetical protein